MPDSPRVTGLSSRASRHVRVPLAALALARAADRSALGVAAGDGVAHLDGDAAVGLRVGRVLAQMGLGRLDLAQRARDKARARSRRNARMRHGRLPSEFLACCHRTSSIGTNCNETAIAAASTRFVTPSLARMLDTCTLAVFSVMNR